ncbi:EexN family lipoprotein [Sulfurospirillum cavolei]|uniref:EexN family lipoprotein n=1 Tax=Sulfurospirillum cavolei TaxID=366522 RepID=UPI000AAFFEDD|nr:EexN family lipoprotein [Sulfurospirillum cavolei]
MKTILLGLLSLSALILLTGCGEEAKTKEYYSQHIDEAEKRVAECEKLEKYNEIQQLDCRNAKRAIEFNPNAKNPFDTHNDPKSFAKLPGAK